MNQLLLPGENMQEGGFRLSAAADKYRYGGTGWAGQGERAHVINDALYEKGPDMRDFSIPPFVQECASAASVDSGGGE